MVPNRPRLDRTSIKRRLHHFCFDRGCKKRKHDWPAEFNDAPLSERPDEGSSDAESGADCTGEEPALIMTASSPAPATPPLRMRSSALQLKEAACDPGREEPACELERDHRTEVMLDAPGKCKVVHLFSGCGKHSDELGSGFKSLGDDVLEYSLEGPTTHQLLDTAGWEKFSHTLRPQEVDLLLLTPPVFTFLKDAGDNQQYRGALRAEREGLPGSSGEVKSRVRMERLCMRRCSQSFSIAQDAGIAVALVLPYGDVYVYNPSAHEAVYMDIAGCSELCHFNVPEDSGDSVFGIC